MEEIKRKGMRYRKPVELRVKLRPEVFAWLDEASEVPPICAVEVFVRGLIEDAYDRYRDTAPDQEVPE